MERTITVKTHDGELVEQDTVFGNTARTLEAAKQAAVRQLSYQYPAEDFSITVGPKCG